HPAHDVLESVLRAGRDLRTRRHPCDRLLDESHVGIVPALPGEVRAMARSMQSELKLNLPSNWFDQTVVDVTEQLVNLLYRRQALFWAQSACDQLGLDLTIYGRDWEHDRHFARHARKHIPYGPPLAQVTRKCAMSLVLEPYVCIAHQRLLDGLAWGGFFLVRNHPAHQFHEQQVNWIKRAGRPFAKNSQELRERLGETERKEFDAFIATTPMTQVVSQPVDLIATTTRMINNGFVDLDQPLVPDFESVAFNSADELLARMKRALDPEFRSQIIARQRERVFEQFDYSRGIARAIEFVRERLVEERAREQKPQALAA
ncbi:MAG TPA: glycosyltransferase, partial [Tepidisphaeraceae bacterium]|nr:glycosyltransferase [Tepidisphaeraceae bacterium]